MWTTSEWHGKRALNFNLRTACVELVCICLISVAPAVAQTEMPIRETEASPRLLSLEEGRAIVNVARQQEPPEAGLRDCSHFVHAIYRNAGFEYAYASSFEIYAGNENFARVRYPHPGDLIAWPGHVGIVVDPLEHSFFSLVRTGLEAQDYRSPYWRSRGMPRFYRYKVQPDTILTATNSVGSLRSWNGHKQPGAGTKVGPKVDEAAAAEDDSPNRPPEAVSERTELIYGPPAPPVSPSLKNADVAFTIPASVMVSTGSEPPTREEVAEGISELSDAGGSVLRNTDPLKNQLPVVIVEQFKVERVEVKRDHGWARLVVDSKVTIGSGATKVKGRHEKVRWELKRTDLGWEAVTPQDRTYVPQDVAVKNLADQLARLTKSDGAAKHQAAVLQEESQLASLLNDLLENK
ncbi:MAG: CHAP domain-containing protein [Candidatus Acidiferrum sp.]